MDTKDQRTEITSSPEFMAPDSTFIPPPPELTKFVADAAGVEITAPAPGENQEKLLTPFQESLQRLRRDKRAMISVIIIGLFVLIAIVGPPIYQHIGPQYNSPLNGKIGPGVYHTFSWQELTRQDELPSGQYWLGTDNLGRDILARLMQGMLISLAVAILVGVVDIALGLLIRVLAGVLGEACVQFL